MERLYSRVADDQNPSGIRNLVPGGSAPGNSGRCRASEESLSKWRHWHSDGPRAPSDSRPAAGDPTPESRLPIRQTSDIGVPPRGGAPDAPIALPTRGPPGHCPRLLLRAVPTSGGTKNAKLDRPAGRETTYHPATTLVLETRTSLTGRSIVPPTTRSM